MALDENTITKITEIFLPTASKLIDRLETDHERLVHYTSADNALKIIKSKKLWLRNARVMDDWSEVDHGLGLLKNYFQNPKSNHMAKFYEAMGGCHNKSGEEVIKLFDNLWQHNHQDTYIACFSQHLKLEDKYGRLSMWRAFSRETAGVALVLKPPRRNAALPLNAFLHPVSYYEDKHLERELNKVIVNIEKNQSFLNSLPPEVVVRFGYLTLMLATVATKHRGFKEEREWRLIHSPAQFPSDHVKSSTQTVRGIPQLVYEIEFENKPTMGINGIQIPDLLDRVIIGPTQYAASIHRALFNELSAAGVADAASKIYYSNIPLR